MVFKRLRDDLVAFKARDPAARSYLEIILCYPGFHALAIHRLANWLWRRKLFLVARFISSLARIVTGIEIHPAAQIGQRFVIDHGIGVVIGETSIIGDDVTLYQGVTLGGIAPSINSHDQVNVKRHPTLCSEVIVGAGAQVLGAITIGAGARIGANSVVTRDVPPGVTAVGIPAHLLSPQLREPPHHFSPYGTPAGGCPDPVIASIDHVRCQLTQLNEHVSQLNKRLEDIETTRDLGASLDDDRNEATVVALGDRK
ncbi:MAG: serine O-acetyltransferase [Hyphomicrobiales bacterium]|nr:serine O-acetyltransferase [Hyphomicrobiales bacterium]